MTVEIRPATENEVDAVLALWNRAVASTAAANDADEVHRVLATSRTSLLVAYDEGTLVGTIIAGWDGWRGNLYRLVVAPERRREGIARRLVAQAEAVLTRHGCPRVSALVDLDPSDGAAFWQDAGYERDADVARFFRALN